MTKSSLPSRLLFVPGWGGSEPEHWQTQWQRELAAVTATATVTVELADWSCRDLDTWVAALDDALATLERRDARPPVLVAHSLGCIAVAHWARQVRRPIRGALLVAPADVEHAPPLDHLRHFGPVPAHRLPFRSLVVASDDDPYVAPERAKSFATHWGSQFVLIIDGGHLNAASGLGDWPAGRELLARLQRRTQLPHADARQCA